MTPRTDLTTASRVDLILILLPEIGWRDAFYSLAASGMPCEVATRVLTMSAERCRRPVAER